jgi:hypothetical protein
VTTMRKVISICTILIPKISLQISSPNHWTKPSLLACEGSLEFVSLFSKGEL